MKLIDVLRKECVVAGAEFADKAEALNQIVNVAKQSPILKDVSAEEILAGKMLSDALIDGEHRAVEDGREVGAFKTFGEGKAIHGGESQG